MEPEKRDQVVGHRVEVLRRRLDLTQQELANLIDCSQSVISDIERGKQSAWGLAPKLAEVLMIDQETLLATKEIDDDELRLRSVAYHVLHAGPGHPDYEYLRRALEHIEASGRQ